MNSEKLIVVSGDSHATIPPEVWPDYVESKYHDLLPGVHEDNEQYRAMFGLWSNFSPELLEIIDTEGKWASGGYRGAWDLDRRLLEMDRDGVSAELVYAGDPRHILPLSPMYRTYPQDVVAAGWRAYHRWITDAFGAASDRILRVGDPTGGIDLDAIMAELTWLADHGFVAAHLPNVNGRDLPPLYDEAWDPYWAHLVDRGMTVVVHAGYGGRQGEFMEKIESIKRKMEAAGGTDLLDAILNEEGFFALDIRPRRAMWQLMLGGVFDRHPDLKLLLAEIRADWMPATLRHLDEVYERVKDDVPAKRKPSEYWHSNGLTSVSFVHKAEVEMRHEIGVETMTFGRDFPHAEGTWPNTSDWLSDAFAGVPDDELRLMLGENAIRVLGLDRAHLATIAERVGPTIEQVTGRPMDLDDRLIANWDTRAGYLKPPEQVDPDAIDALLDQDLVEFATAN